MQRGTRSLRALAQRPTCAFSAQGAARYTACSATTWNVPYQPSSGAPQTPTERQEDADEAPASSLSPRLIAFTDDDVPLFTVPAQEIADVKHSLLVCAKMHTFQAVVESIVIGAPCEY